MKFIEKKAKDWLHTRVGMEQRQTAYNLLGIEIKEVKTF